MKQKIQKKNQNNTVSMWILGVAAITLGVVMVASGGIARQSAAAATTKYNYRTTLMQGSTKYGGATIKACKTGKTIKLQYKVYSDGQIIGTSFDANKYPVTKTLKKGTYTHSRVILGNTLNYSGGKKNMGAASSISVAKIGGC